MTDWKQLKEDMSGNFKQYIEDGVYKAKCDKVEIKEVGSNGSVIMKFHFEDTESAQYPTADHWLSFNNANWRKWHNRCLMIVLGLTEEQAEKTVDICEKTDKKEAIVKAYDQMYAKLLAKKPEVEIEVYTDGKYARAEFTDRSVAMPRGNGEKKIVNDTVPADMPEPDDDAEVDLSDVPF